MASKLQDLAPDLRAVAEVGLFMQQWGIIESKLNRAVGKALKLDLLQTAIATANISFRDKIQILRTCISIAIGFSAEQKQTASSRLTTLLNYYQRTRNLVAHTPFWPADDGNGVKFSVTRAKGKLEFPEEVWSFSKFAEERVELALRLTELTEIDSLLSKEDLLVAMLRQPNLGLSGGLFGLAGLGPHGLLPLSNQHSDIDPSTEGTHAQTPPSEQE